MRLLIRDYKPSDRPLLVACLDTMQDHMVRIDPWGRTIRSSDHGTQLAGLVLQRVRQRDGFILVAAADGEPVAVAVAWIGKVHRVERTEQLPTLAGWISDLAVLPVWRGKGIGTRLLRAVEARFRKMGCDQMTLGVFAPNRGAFRLYTREGFVVRSMLLGKRLAKPRTAWPRRPTHPSRA